MAMSHDAQHGINAERRARSGYAPGWHPILDARETEPGVWYLVGQYDRCYGIVRLLEIGGERGYRAVTWAERSEDRQLIGYFTTLRTAAESAHRDAMRSNAPGRQPLR